VTTRPRALLFDWDNTLVDSWLVIHDALVVTFTAMGHEPWTLAETKDHLNWELIGEIVKSSSGDAVAALKQAHDKVEPEEDEHLYHTSGWTRELWIGALGMPAVLPPPEEERDVKTAIEAARAKKARANKARAKSA